MKVQHKQECSDLSGPTGPSAIVPEPCACYAEGYAAGSGTETGSRTAFPEGGFQRLGLL